MRRALVIFFITAISFEVMAAPNQDLLKAVKSGNANAATAALNAGADVNFKDELGRTPLFYAAARGNIALAKLLVAKKASPNIMDSSGWGPHDVAIDANYPDMLAYLASAGLNPALLKKTLTTPDQEGFLPIHATAREGRLAMFDLLLKYGSPVDPVSKEGYTPLILAAANVAAGGGRDAMIARLAGLGADLSRSDKNGLTALDFVIQAGNEALAKKIAKAPVSASTAARVYAAGNMNLFSFLLPFVKDLDAPGPMPEGKPLLFFVMEKADIATMKTLLARGASPMATLRFGRNAIQYAAALGNLAVVKTLIEAGAPPNNPDRKNAVDAPLSLAAAAGNRPLAEYLLSVGAQLDEPQGVRTPLNGAIMGKQPEMVRFLVERGANPNGTGESGITALMYAIDYRGKGGDIAIIGYLLDKGADPNVGVSGFGSAVDWADRNRRPEIADLLVSRGGIRLVAPGGGVFIAPKTELQENIDRFHRLIGSNDDEAWKSAINNLPSVNQDLGDGKTPLFETVRSGNLSRVRYLESKEADFSSLTAEGRTMLHAACESGNMELVKFLVESKRLSVAKKDSSGKSALFEACLHPGMVEWLCGKGGDPRETDASGGTLLLTAAGFPGDIANGTIAFLIASGVDVNVKAPNGRNALDKALLMNNEQGAELLRKAGAVQSAPGTTPGPRKRP